MFTHRQSPVILVLTRMDNFRRPQNKKRQTLDGFVVSGSAPIGGLNPVGGKRGPVNSLPSQNRRVDDFRRASGLYPVSNPNIAFDSGNGALGAKDKARKRAAAAKSLGSSASRSLPPINLALEDEQTKRSRRKRSKRTAKRLTKFQKVRKYTLRTALVCFALIIAIGGLLLTQGYLKFHKVFHGGSTAAALQANVDPSKLKGEGDGRVNILLLGIGGPQHDGSDLTDTIMLASIDPVNNQASLLSIPRDLWVKMPNNFISNYQKINAAYESGKYEYLGKEDSTNGNVKAVNAGFSAVDSTIEQVVGVPIHYNLLVNFQAFQKAVDTVGGVTVNVPTDLWDPTMAWQNNHNPILAKAGVDTFNGSQALNYVRSRETSSDFARGERQRAVILALKQKTLTLGTLSNPLKISELINTFGNNVESDISLSDMTRLVAIMKKTSNNNIKSVGLTDGTNKLVTTGNINGISVVEPVAGEYDYSAIQTYIRGILKDGYIAKENADITVLNGSTIPGLATAKATDLKSYGYNVGTVDNAPTTDYPQTKIIDLTHGADKYTLHYLQTRYNGAAVTTTVPPGITPGTANIIVILGQNETLTSQN
jgi:LCP family protein required for cell wall assembly